MSETAQRARAIREYIPLSLQDILKGIEEGRRLGIEDPLVAIGARYAQGLAVNVRGDRQAWEIRKGREMAAAWRSMYPQVDELFPAPAAPSVVHVIDLRWPRVNPGPRDPAFDSRTVMVASSAEKALEFITSQDHSTDAEVDYFWCVSESVLDDPRAQMSHSRYFDRHGQEHASAQLAQEAGVQAPSAAP